MLSEYKKNFFSQNGEDGIIIELLKRIDLKKNYQKWCCEFGAWDGIHGSNTFNLVKNYNYNAVYIEGNSKRFKDLVETKKKFSKIRAFNYYVNWKKKSSHSLDKILKKTKITKNFEILSIDIDSYDLAVWKSLVNYQPKIVVIEVNSGIKPGVFQIHSKKKKGNSFTATVTYAKKIGYELVCHTGNCIFVKKKYLKNIKIKNEYVKNPQLLFDKSWLHKKDNIIKKLLLIYLPEPIKELLRKVKKYI